MLIWSIFLFRRCQSKILVWRAGNGTNGTILWDFNTSARTWLKRMRETLVFPRPIYPQTSDYIRVSFFPGLFVGRTFAPLPLPHSGGWIPKLKLECLEFTNATVFSCSLGFLHLIHQYRNVSLGCTTIAAVLTALNLLLMMYLKNSLMSSLM